MQKSRSEFVKEVREILVNEIKQAIWKMSVGCQDEAEVPVDTMAGLIADYVHTQHYPMAPEPEFLEDPTKPPVDPGPGRIA